MAVSDERIEDLSDIPDADLDRMREIRDAARAKAQAKVSDGRRRWWGFAERLDRAGQIGQGFPDRNQLAALTLHGFILPGVRPYQ